MRGAPAETERRPRPAAKTERLPIGMISVTISRPRQSKAVIRCSGLRTDMPVRSKKSIVTEYSTATPLSRFQKIQIPVQIHSTRTLDKERFFRTHNTIGSESAGATNRTG